MVCNQFQGCLVVIQQGGPDTWYNWGGPAKVGPRKSFLFTESSVVVKKNLMLLQTPINTVLYVKSLSNTQSS